MIEASEYQLRRNKLLEAMEPNSVAVLFAGVARKSTADEFFDFEVNRSFYYLTGIKQENSVLLLAKTSVGNSSYLFVDEKKVDVEKWYGLKISADEAKQISGIENVLFRNTLGAKLDMALGGDMTLFGEVKYFYIDMEDDLKIDSHLSTVDFAENMKMAYQHIELKDIHDSLSRLRMVKSEAEIEEIKEAIKTTELGLNKVLKELAVAKYEYNLKNAFECAIKDDDNSTLAFHSIVASGPNGVILHYPSAESALHKDDLVLLDVGAAHNLYNADISRTYPISGKYNELQRKIYNIVLECQKVCISFLHPGVTLQEYKTFARDFLASECVAQGLIERKEDIGNVYYHGVGHHLGLDTHDQCLMNEPLMPGMILTCEPGLYFKEYGIGIRIEDDVLITNTGSEVLSKDIIKTIEDIEAFLSL